MTLPSGDEEIILNYDMCFSDKTAYQNWKDNGNGGYDKYGELSAMNAQKNPFGKQDEESGGEVDAYSLDLEFKLCKLVSFLRKQGYPIDNSFVSYYSVDF